MEVRKQEDDVELVHAGETRIHLQSHRVSSVLMVHDGRSRLPCRSTQVGFVVVSALTSRFIVVAHRHYLNLVYWPSLQPDQALGIIMPSALLLEKLNPWKTKNPPRLCPNVVALSGSILSHCSHQQLRLILSDVRKLHPFDAFSHYLHIHIDEIISKKFHVRSVLSFEKERWLVE